jgi:hypothetical protein
MQRPGHALAALVLAVVVSLSGCASSSSAGNTASPTSVRVASATSRVNPARLSLAPYQGLGAWVDVFDYSPVYQQPGQIPSVTPDGVADMAAVGVKTLFLQASRTDPHSPGLIVDRPLVRRFLEQAHTHGMRVVAWYLPKLGDVAADLRHVQALLDFRAGSRPAQRFDGIAIDIEDVTTVTDPATRNAHLVDLSQRIDRIAGDMPVGAIVLPPVAIEVVNPGYWPAFPWRAIAPHYDVWLPMGYWTVRSQASGYRDAFVYTDENIRRLRANVGDARAPVHAIGGIGDTTTARDDAGFVRAVRANHAIGWSIYDWATSSSAAWTHLR